MWPQNKTEGEKQQPSTRSTETTLPPRVQKRASEGASKLEPRKFQENPKNAWGPELHPEENAKKQDARPRRAKNQTRRDKKNKNKQKQVRVGVSCYHLSCVSRKKMQKKKETKATSTKKPKEERLNPKTQGLTSRESSKHFREQTAKS